MACINHPLQIGAQSPNPQIARVIPSLQSNRSHIDATALTQELVHAMIETVVNVHAKKASYSLSFHFPQDVLHRIFHYSGLLALSCCRQVNIMWNHIACDPKLEDEVELKKHVPLFLTIFDKADWDFHYDLKTLGLNFDDLQPLNHRMIYSILNKLEMLRKLEDNMEFTLFCVPKTLTYSMLEEFAKHPKNGFAIRFRMIWQVFINECGQIPVKKSYRVLISHRILAATQGIPIIEKVQIIKNNDCEIPKALELILLHVITYLNAHKRLFATGHFDFSICEEKFENICFQVGGYLGINVSYDPVPETEPTRAATGAALALRNIFNS